MALEARWASRTAKTKRSKLSYKRPVNRLRGTEGARRDVDKVGGRLRVRKGLGQAVVTKNFASGEKGENQATRLREAAKGQKREISGLN